MEKLSTSEIAASSIWPWKDKQFALTGASVRALRKQACWRSGSMLIATAAFYYFSHVTMASIVSSIALLTWLMAMISPLGLYVAFDRRVHWLVVGVMWIFQWLILVLVYFFIFTPFGVLFRRGNKGPMPQAYDESKSSYWLLVRNEPQQRDKQF